MPKLVVEPVNLKGHLTESINLQVFLHVPKKQSGGMERHRLWNMTDVGLNLVFITYCIPLGKLLKIARSQFPHL